MAARSGPADVSERILQSGEWSDLTISTATRDFKVHKAIVCRMCPFMDAACSRDFKEARTGVVDVPESEKIVEDLLRFIYGLELGSLTFSGHGPELASEVSHLLDLHLAADKYQIDDLKTETTEAIVSALEFGTCSELAEIGKTIFNHEASVVTRSLRGSVVGATGKWIQYIKHEGGWEVLWSCPEYAKLVMEWVLENPESVIQKRAMKF